MAARRNLTPEQIVRKLRKADGLEADGNSKEEIARQLGVTTQTVLNWRRRYGGMSVTRGRELYEFLSFVGSETTATRRLFESGRDCLPN